jgi:predicted HicB family RNase H-like nuclease
MRGCVHDSTAKFRVNGGLLADAEQKARAQGMSLSEFMRHALRREVREAA